MHIYKYTYTTIPKCYIFTIINTCMYIFKHLSERRYKIVESPGIGWKKGMDGYKKVIFKFCIIYNDIL